MAKRSGNQTVRYVFLAANGLFWAFSVALICYNVYVAVTSENTFEAILSLKVALYLTFVCGVGIFIAGLIGCFTGVRLNRKCITTYLVISSFFMVLGLVTIILVAVVAKDFDLNAWFKLSLDERASIQGEFGCCGFYDPSPNSSDTNIFDISCFNITRLDSNTTYYEPYTTGCEQFLVDSLGSNSTVIIALLACIMCAEIMGITSGAIILRRIRPPSQEKKEVGLTNDGFEEKPRHKYRKIAGPVDMDADVYKDDK